MATPSSLISIIDPLVHSDIARFSPTALKLRIGLRNIKVTLVCLRSLCYFDQCAMRSLFSRIKAAIVRLPIYNCGHDLWLYERDEEPLDDLRVVNCLAKEVNDKCAWCFSIVPNHLKLDDALEVVDTLLDNIADFLKVVRVHLHQAETLKSLGDEMSEFEVQARFLRGFILFAKGAGDGAYTDQIQYNLLFLIRPFLRGAACAFQTSIPIPNSSGGDYRTILENQGWVEEVHSRFPRHSLLVFQFFTQALLSMPRLRRIHYSVLKDFLSSLISLFWHLMRYQRHHPRHSVNLKTLYECLRLSRFILKQQQQTNSGNFEDQIGVLIRDVGILICSLHLKDVDPQTLSDLVQRFDFVKARVSLQSNSPLKANALDYGDSTSMEDVSDIETASTSHESKSTPPDAGFQKDEVTEVLDRLLGGSKQLRLVPITGMAGLGKTTFALKIYNHPTVMRGFPARAWCTISQVLDKKKVLFQLLQQVQPGDYSKTTEDDLANKLRKSLKGKRYLILLDDVWTPQAWESLRLSFDDDRTHSRVVLTSRLDTIVPHEQPHFLRQRSENECLEIIEMNLSHTVENNKTELGKFAKLCKGLPLTAVLVAGLLSTTVQKGWDGILDRLSSGGISDMEQCKIALELSCKHLPNELKLCFIYFGAFPEDEEICVRNLIHLWIAEGFVIRNKDLLKKRIEDVARGYLDNLVRRNLVMVVTKRSTGGIKTCRVHDLLHDFCLMKGKQENIFHLLLEKRDELSDFIEPCNMESRLCIHSSALHFKNSSLFCPLAQSMLLFSSLAQSMLFFSPTDDRESCLPDIVFIIQIYKNLRVFYADQMWFDTSIPSEIELLTRLTYFFIRCHNPVIPSSIGNLSNLETLIIEHDGIKTVLLPHTIWNLQKLKYLRITHLYQWGPAGFSLPEEDLKNYPNLLELESICGVEFSSGASMEKQMRKFPNIRSLKCNIRSMNVVVPKFLGKLEFITLNTFSELQYQLDFGCAENLKKLTLRGFNLSRREIAVIGKLPNLEVLKLLGIVFLEGTLEMEEWEFSNLRILVFGTYSWYIGCVLETWTAAGDDPLPCLEKLEFRKCSELKEIPSSYLETSSTLEEIKVSGCSFALESLVRDIQVAQNGYGNSIKVQIQR